MKMDSSVWGELRRMGKLLRGRRWSKGGIMERDLWCKWCNYSRERELRRVDGVEKLCERSDWAGLRGENTKERRSTSDTQKHRLKVLRWREWTNTRAKKRNKKIKTMECFRAMDETYNNVGLVIFEACADEMNMTWTARCELIVRLIERKKRRRRVMLRNSLEEIMMVLKNKG